VEYEWTRSGIGALSPKVLVDEGLSGESFGRTARRLIILFSLAAVLIHTSGNSPAALSAKQMTGKSRSRQ